MWVIVSERNVFHTNWRSLDSLEGENQLQQMRAKPTKLVVGIGGMLKMMLVLIAAHCFKKEKNNKHDALPCGSG